MRGRKITTVLVISLFMLVAFAILVLWPYSINEFHGDGRITDSGFWSHPRYHIIFPQWSLTDSETCTFVCKGLPPVPLTFCLRVLDPSNIDLLSGSDTSIEFKLTDVHGRILCEGNDPLKNWVLSSSVVQTRFWHPKFRKIKVKRNVEYTLTLNVKNVDPGISDVSFEPFLKGGGNELP